MKKIIFSLLSFILLAGALYAQTPKGFNYQAVVRNSAGQLMANRMVSVRISILQGSPSGTAVYHQTDNVTTNANGLFSLVVGENSADFDNINWSHGPYYIVSEIGAGAIYGFRSRTNDKWSEERQADLLQEQLEAIRQLLPQVPLPSAGTSPSAGDDCPSSASPQQPAIIAIGEVGLDYYWSREFEREQLMAFEEQVKWSVESRLPLMIHCRKAQNEMVSLLKHYKDELQGGVFHCFTGNEHEAEELLQFPQFVLGIGGVLTFKKSHLPEVLPQVVPLERIVLETDAPYMAPVPMRGKRNESAYVRHVLQRLAEAYDVSEDHLEQVTDQNVRRIFKI